MEPHCVDVGEGRIGLSEGPREQDCKQLGIDVVEKVRHGQLNHTVSRRQKLLAIHGTAYQLLDILQKVAMTQRRGAAAQEERQDGLRGWESAGSEERQTRRMEPGRGRG